MAWIQSRVQLDSRHVNSWDIRKSQFDASRYEFHIIESLVIINSSPNTWG